MTTTITDQIAQLESLRSKTVELEREIERERAGTLASLPEQYGFETVAQFIKAVKSAAGNSGGKRHHTKRAGVKAAKAPVAKGKRAKGRAKRAHITDEMRSQLRELVGAGKSGSQIAKELGISPASVQNVKKALGLVKAR